MNYAETVSAASDRRAWRAVRCASSYPTQEGTWRWWFPPSAQNACYCIGFILLCTRM